MKCHRWVAYIEPDPDEQPTPPETPGEEMLASQVKSILLRARSRKLRKSTEASHDQEKPSKEPEKGE